MKHSPTRVLAAALGSLALAASPALAHHSAAMFDNTKEVSVVGTVKAWQWSNPHSWLQLETLDAKGARTEQGFECGSPNTLFRNGWRVDSFKPGDKVELITYPRRDGSLGGMLVAAKKADGAWLEWLPSAAKTVPRS